MEAAFGWIGRLFEFLGAFIPRLLIVEATQVGVAFCRGRHVVCLLPGLHWYWPFWTTTDVRAAVRQTQNLPIQALQTEDNRTIAVGGMVRYRVDDAYKALAETYDLDAAITDESLPVICGYVTARPLAEIVRDRRAADTAITLQIRAALRDYGVYVLRAQLTDLSHCVTLCHLGQASAMITRTEQVSENE